MTCFLLYAVDLSMQQKVDSLNTIAVCLRMDGCWKEWVLCTWKKNVMLETVAMGFFPWDPDAAGWFWYLQGSYSRPLIFGYKAKENHCPMTYKMFTFFPVPLVIF